MDFDAIKLRAQRQGTNPDLFGYYDTAEGRSFLRGLYATVVAAKLIADGKMATIIADDHATFPLQEVDRTKAALSRWRSKDQAELFVGDGLKTRRVVERLEAELMALPEAYEVMSDQAAAIVKVDVGQALARFFYSTKPDRSLLRSLLEAPTKVFSFHLLTEDEDHAILWSASKYAHMLRPPGCDFLVCHEFVLSHYQNDPTRVGLERHFSGYAFPMQNNETHRLLIEQGNPTRRYYDTLRPTPVSNLGDFEGFEPGDIALWFDRTLIDADGRSPPKSPEFTVYRGVLRPIVGPKAEFISKYVEKLMWDIVL